MATMINLPPKGKRRGLGFTVTAKGYVRITKGPDRYQYAHRVKARKCMEASGLKLTPDLEVDHLCGNPECDTDFHLLILPGPLHDINNSGIKGKSNPFYKKHARG